jgi:hypothetical protein
MPPSLSAHSPRNQASLVDVLRRVQSRNAAGFDIAAPAKTSISLCQKMTGRAQSKSRRTGADHDLLAPSVGYLASISTPGIVVASSAELPAYRSVQRGEP